MRTCQQFLQNVAYRRATLAGLCSEGAAGAARSASRSVPGALRERPGAVRQRQNTPTRYGQMNTREKSQKIHQTNAKKTFLFEKRNDQICFGCMRRTDVPLWPDGARKAPPGRPGTRPGALRERPGGAQKSYSLLANGRTLKITLKNQKKTYFFKI